MITSSARFDLSRDSRPNDRRVVSAMYAVPNGTRVILFVGSRRFADPETVHQLRQYVTTHHFDVQGEPDAVESWVAALRGDEFGVRPNRWSA